MEEPIEIFDELPISGNEINAVSRLFWNAQSIQDNIKSQLPQHHKKRFTKGVTNNGCDIQSISKAEGSADICELNDNPDKMGKFVYKFNLSCQFGSYQVSICSRQENKLLNQVKVTNPERLVAN